jgi:hypothetical protein
VGSSKLLLAYASALILRSESHETHDHTLLSHDSTSQLLVLHELLALLFLHYILSILLHKQNSNIYLKNSTKHARKGKQTNVQNINRILPDLRYVYILVYRCNRIRCL